MTLAINYRYVLERAALLAPGGNILDYGCGAGDTVEAARLAGMDMVGCDVFYDGNVTPEERAKDRLGRLVFEMKEGRIPFPDDHFDMVVSNQVFEHVPDIGLALDEIRRVLKPGAPFLNIFPSIGVIREGHCGVPLAHWLNGAPALQRKWLLAGRTLGLGYFKEGKTKREWASFFSDWLRSFTVYRTMRTIRREHLKRFSSLEWLEPDYIAFRLDLGGRRSLARLARTKLALFSRIAARRLGSMVLVAR